MNTVLNSHRTTILVIEDDETVLRVVSRIIVHAGFHVLPSSSAGEALKIGNEYRGTIQLLLSDIVMPDMSGPEIAKKMKILRPDMKVILMSGYPDGALSLLNYGWHFLQKPFLPRNLISSIKEVLASEVAGEGFYRPDTQN
ncbi:MAG: response regulator [Acidobacteriota bacterium]|nr:response regulator [Acidobacteriota bacterium]